MTKRGVSVGVYLTAERPGYPCARLPVGIGWTPDPWTWFSPFSDPALRLLENCPLERPRSRTRGPQLSVECRVCPAGHSIARTLHGLVWSARERTADLDEWKRDGVRIAVPFFPIGLEFGKTVVFVARHQNSGAFEYAITDCFAVTGVDLVSAPGLGSELSESMARTIGPRARVVVEGVP